ncbi:hypothetical protein BD779DRAFT_1505434 [Infundibulicybe gibba]|nr:hypothetical protein BD779DRAFT_1505434 [Infundibulicybe gibba]
MDQEQGDEYLRRLATFIRTNERSLAEAAPRRRRAARPPPSEATSVFNPLGWLGLDNAAQTSTPHKPLVLAIDMHHLFYVLMRLEALGLDVGTLDVEVENPSRPTSYINLFSGPDKSDTLSLSSFRSSLSVVSNLSLGGGWWGRSELPTLDLELKFIYSSFTKLPALSVTAPGPKVITELMGDPPNTNAIPLDAFKNLQNLECVDIDPRTLLGWDKLACSLVSLKIKKSGLEDLSVIFIGAVIDDEARREGSASRKRKRRIPHSAQNQSAFYTTRLPDTVHEDVINESDELPPSGSPSPPPPTTLSSSKWAFLKHLSLTDNALTFFPAESIPYLTSLSHLDLSSNLLVSVPTGLGALHNLVSLNLSDNMIDSVLGIYLTLGQVLILNISRNRLESICGLERLLALERVDLRNNLIDDSAEIGRLATLPNITEVRVEGNPFVESEEGYRVICFDYFWKEGKTITLDGTPPSFYEKRNLTTPPPQQMSSSRPLSTAYSPPVVAVGHIHHHPSPSIGTADKIITSSPSPQLGSISATGVGGKARRKKPKRIVDLDGENSDTSSRGFSHTRVRSDGSSRIQPKRVKPKKKDEDDIPSTSPNNLEGSGILPKDARAIPSKSPPEVKAQFNTVARPSNRSRHSRHHTEFLSSASDFSAPDLPPFNSKLDPISSVGPSGAPISLRRNQGSATFSPKSASRRARVSASVYEPPPGFMEDEGGVGDEIKESADAYRKRIEALKKDMGDGWLKVFSQSQIKTPTST